MSLFPEDIEPYLDKLSLDQLNELMAHLSSYDSVPVGIDEFLESDKFLGPYFSEGLYPYWKEELRRIFPSPFHSPYWLISLRGSIGQGKTTIGCAGILYDIYRLLCNPNPQADFDLVPTTKILIAIFNVTLSLVTDVVWEKMSSMMIQSPFFSGLLGV